MYYIGIIGAAILGGGLTLVSTLILTPKSICKFSTTEINLIIISLSITGFILLIISYDNYLKKIN